MNLWQLVIKVLVTLSRWEVGLYERLFYECQDTLVMFEVQRCLSL